MNFLISALVSVVIIFPSWTSIFSDEINNFFSNHHRYTPSQIADIALSPFNLELMSEIVVSNNNVNKNENFGSFKENQKIDQFNNNFETPNIGNFANQVSGNARQQTKQENYIYRQSQDLAAAAAQIQDLLMQLERDNPTATDAEKINYVTQKTNGSFKKRFIKALTAGGESALEEYLTDSSYVRIIRSMVSAWLNQG